jgi:hypothetical protein
MVRFTEAAVDEGPPAAVLSTLDRVRADSTHTYTWQLNLGGPEGDGGVRVERGRDASGASTFVLHGRRDSYVKGWVLRPTEARLEMGDPLRIRTEGAAAEIWVVMAVGTGTPPDGRVTGAGRNTTLQVGTQRIRYNAEAHRIEVANAAEHP